MRLHLHGNGAAHTPTIAEDLEMMRQAGFEVKVGMLQAGFVVKVGRGK
jgi:hypothetical protein